MSDLITRPSLDVVFSSLLDEILRRGSTVTGVRDTTSVGSAFGHKTRPYRELLGADLRLVDSPVTLLSTPSRRADPTYACANLLWALSGSDLAVDIGYYNGRAASFTDDGVRLAGAIGPRLAGGYGQLRHAVELLRLDPTSRRAVVPLLYPTDLLTGQRDFPCALAVQFLVRDGALCAVTFMRSQSALMVLPYDLVLFTGLQHLVADELGLGVGDYVHLMSSCHVYDDELALAESVRQEMSESVVFHPMRGGLTAATETIRFEKELRQAVVATDRRAVERLAATALDRSHDFWAEVRLLLVRKAAVVLNASELRECVDEALEPRLLTAIQRLNNQ